MRIASAVQIMWVLFGCSTERATISSSQQNAARTSRRRTSFVARITRGSAGTSRLVLTGIASASTTSNALASIRPR